jgi:external thioesterase TEII
MRKSQLFLLHFAGGNCYSFQFMEPLLRDFELTPLELPGRGRRIRESLLKDFDVAAQDIYHQIIRKLHSSCFLIYGHSMGAYLALRVANMLEKDGKIPAYIIVSGNAGPGIKSDKRKDLHLLPHKEFIEELEGLGGVPPEVIKNEELFAFFEPILRADFEISEKNEIAREPATSASLYAIMGSREEKVDQITNWGRFTKSDFNYEILEGNHFFIHKHPQRIAAIIKNCGDKVTLLQHH